jgi:hypothetical protein
MNMHSEKYQVSDDGYNAACYLVCHIAAVSHYTSTKRVNIAQRFDYLMPYLRTVDQLWSSIV